MAKVYTNSLSEVTSNFPTSNYVPEELKDVDYDGYTVTSQAITVPAASPYILDLTHQVKDQSSFRIRDALLVDFVRRDFNDTIAVGEYGLDAESGLVKFNSANAGDTLYASYTHVGSVVKSDLLHKIQKELVAIEENTTQKISTTTDNAIVRFDGTEGDLQNSSITLSDAGALNGIASINHSIGLDLSINNTSILNLSSSELLSSVPLELPDGSAAAPSLHFVDTDTGFYSSATPYLDVAIAGTRTARFGANELWSIQDILLTQGKGLILDTDQDTKIYCSGDDVLSFNIGGARKGGFAADGDFDFVGKVGIGNSSPFYDLDILASAASPLRVLEKGGEECFKLSGDLTDLENLSISIGDIDSVSNGVLLTVDNGNNKIDLTAATTNVNGNLNCTGYLAFDSDTNTYLTGDGSDSLTIAVNGASISRFTQYYLRNESGSCQMQWSSGNAATPGYSFNGDTNTGLARTAADTLALATAGVAAITINSTQDVTFGGEIIAPSTTPPASAAAAGTAGQVAFDATSIYYCVASGNWVKATLASW